MRVFLLAAITVVAIAFGADIILDQAFQMDSETAFTTEGARLSTSEVGTQSN